MCRGERCGGRGESHAQHGTTRGSFFAPDSTCTNVQKTYICLSSSRTEWDLESPCAYVCLFSYPFGRHANVNLSVLNSAAIPYNHVCMMTALLPPGGYFLNVREIETAHLCVCVGSVALLAPMSTEVSLCVSSLVLVSVGDF